MSAFVILLVLAVVFNGLLAGTSFDTALVKLPARRRIGARAYAVFARGNDLGNLLQCVSRAAACARHGTRDSASVSPTPAVPDCRSIEGHTHVPTGIVPRIGDIAVAVARDNVCPDSIRRAC